MLGKKIPTILGLLLLGVLIGAAYYFLVQAKPKVSTELVPNNVKITNVADNKFSVSWTTTQAAKGEVEYGSVGEKLTSKGQDDKGSGKYFTHHVTLTGLQPNTQYSFRILSGEPVARFDNKGTPYAATTGPTISNVPVSRNIYGDVAGATEDAIVYINLPNAHPASTVLKNNGTYTLPISTMRSADLKSYVTFDPSATVVAITLEDGKKTTQVSASTANIAPVPKITMGKNEDFRNLAPQQATVAEVDTAAPQASSPAAIQQPQIFNVEPLAPGVNEVAGKGTTITNPSTEGEVLTTTKPEFAGTGTSNAMISIAISGQKTISDTVRVDNTGNWKWAPPIELKTGKQKITLTYTDSSDKQQKLTRSFSISTAKVDSAPAFVATPSGGLKSSTPTPSPSASASPRAAMPATESGVPVTGVMAPTMMTLGLGIMGVMAGILMFAL